MKFKRFLIFLTALLVLTGGFQVVYNTAFAAEQLYANNVKTTLAAPISDVATSLTLTSATGFPTIAGSDWHMMHLIDAAGTMEIVKVTARTGVTCTVTRGQEGTSGVVHTASPVTVCSINLTAGTLDRFEDGIHELLPGDGTAADPSHSFASDPDTGFYSAAANQIGMTTGGTGQVKLIDGVFQPITDSDVDLGLTAVRFKNAYVDTYSATSQPSFRAVMSGNQSLTGGFNTSMYFDTDSGSNDAWDTGSWFNTTTYTATVPAGQGGKYAAQASLHFGVVAAGDRLSLEILVNGTRRVYTTITAYNGNPHTIGVSDTLLLDAADTITVKAMNADNTDVAQAAISYSFFTMTKLN